MDLRLINVDLNVFEIKDLIELHKSIAKRHSDICWTQKKLSEKNPVHVFGNMRTKEDWKSSAESHRYRRDIHLKRAIFLKKLIK